MGHFHAREMSIQMLGLLMNQHFKETGYNKFGDCVMSGGGLKKPEEVEPFSTERFVEHFISRLTVIDKALDEIKKKHPAAEHYLRDLSDHHYGMSCSEGVYKDLGMIEMGVEDILYEWEQMELVKKVNGGWILDFERMKQFEFKDLIIEEIES